MSDNKSVVEEMRAEAQAKREEAFNCQQIGDRGNPEILHLDAKWLEIWADRIEAEMVPRPQWISVKDRLPEGTGLILAGGENVGPEIMLGRHLGSSIAFTHWMPLPEPPKEAESDER